MTFRSCRGVIVGADRDPSENLFFVVNLDGYILFECGVNVRRVFTLRSSKPRWAAISYFALVRPRLNDWIDARGASARRSGQRAVRMGISLFRCLENELNRQSIPHFETKRKHQHGTSVFSSMVYASLGGAENRTTRVLPNPDNSRAYDSAQAVACPVDRRRVTSACHGS